MLPLLSIGLQFLPQVSLHARAHLPVRRQIATSVQPANADRVSVPAAGTGGTETAEADTETAGTPTGSTRAADFDVEAETIGAFAPEGARGRLRKLHAIPTEAFCHLAHDF